MDVKGLTKKLNSRCIITLKEVAQSHLVGEEGLTLLAGQALQLVVLGMQGHVKRFLEIGHYLDKVVAVSPKEGFVLEVLRIEEWDVLLVNAYFALLWSFLHADTTLVKDLVALLTILRILLLETLLPVPENVAIKEPVCDLARGIDNHKEHEDVLKDCPDPWVFLKVVLLLL